MDLQLIRNRSWELVSLYQLPIHPSLPLLDPPNKLTALANIADRSLIVSVLLSCIYGYDKRRALKWLQREELAGTLEPNEWKFMQNQLDLSSRGFIYNQVEGLWALAWALSLEPSLSYLSYCSNQLVRHFPELNDAHHKSDFLEKVALRDLRELLEACDLAYCLHWSYVELRFRRQDNPMPIKEFAIVERRRALEWILYGGNWYEIDLST